MSKSENLGFFNRILYNKKFGIFLSVLQLVITIAFLGLILNLNVLPNKYLGPIIVILLVFEAITLFTQLFKKGPRAGKFFAIIVSIILGFGCSYLIKTHMVLTDISQRTTRIDDVSIIVLKEDPAEAVEDAKNYLFGIQEVIDRENTDKTIEELSGEFMTDIKVQIFDDFEEQINALYNGKVGAIVLNEAYRETIREAFEDFNERTRVLYSHKIEQEMVIETEGKEVLTEPFNVYISGIDTFGSIRTTSRSDVNIIATVNPITKKVLLTTTPRDYYVPFPITNGIEDKLTHAGVYGIDVSIGTLEELYDIDIDYYARINFTSFIGIVDAMGGITVNSDYNFSTKEYSFTKGLNNINGEEALAFSRERYAFADGDHQRGRNQMEVIKAMIEKGTSPAILTNYNDIMNNVAGSVDTSASYKDITSLVKKQIDDPTPWKVETNDVTGEGAMKTTYTYKSQPLYVCIPDMDSVAEAREKMLEVMAER